MTDLNDKLRAAANYIDKLGGDSKPYRIALEATPAAQAAPSWLAIAGIGVKHFGNPIPQAWYVAAKELLAAVPASLTPAPQGTASEHPDTKRLDYMIFYSAYIGHSRDAESCRVWRIEDGEESAVTGWHSDARRAIDDAMVESGAASLTQAATSEPVASTDLSTKLRRLALMPGGQQVKTTKDVLIAAADEIERYYGGMLNWKRTAEAKDAAPPAAHPAPSVKTWQERADEDFGGDAVLAMEAEIADHRAAKKSAQQAPSDDEIERAALEHVAPGWTQMAAVLGKQDDYRQTEQFARLKAFVAALSAQQAGVQEARSQAFREAAEHVWQYNAAGTISSDVLNALVKLKRELIAKAGGPALSASSAVTNEDAKDAQRYRFLRDELKIDVELPAYIGQLDDDEVDNAMAIAEGE